MLSIKENEEECTFAPEAMHTRFAGHPKLEPGQIRADLS